MAEPASNTTAEVPISNDVDEEAPAVAKSAEDRKAAAAMSSLDKKEDEGTSKDVDQEAVKKAMERLAGGSGTAGKGKAVEAKEKTEPKKVVKVDAADVALLVEELDLTKPVATELLKAHNADVKAALTAFITPN